MVCSIGLRESEKGQCTARSLKNKEALQACLHNQSMFVPEATFLGVSTRGAPRRNSDKENARVADACNQYKLLATLRLSAERYAFYSRYFAISKVTYGWLGRSPTQGLCTKLWNALKAGQRVTHMANRWIRAMVHGGLNHLDILAATNLLRVVYGIWNKGLASWNSIAGTPVISCGYVEKMDAWQGLDRIRAMELDPCFSFGRQFSRFYFSHWTW